MCFAFCTAFQGCSGDFFPSFNRTNLIQHDIQGDHIPVAAVINTVRCDLWRFLFYRNKKDHRLLKKNGNANITLSLKVSTTGGVSYQHLDISDLFFFVGGDEVKPPSAIAATPWPSFLYKMTGTVSSDIDFVMPQNPATRPQHCPTGMDWTSQNRSINKYSPLSFNTLGLDEWLTKVFDQMESANVRPGSSVALKQITLETSFQLQVIFKAGVAELIKFVPVRSTPMGDYNTDRTHKIKIVLQGDCPRCDTVGKK